MADQQTWNPVPELKQKYPGLKDWSDEKIYNNLSDPNKFRSAFPQYANLGDDVIKRNIDHLKPSIQPQAAPANVQAPVMPSKAPEQRPPDELRAWTPTPLQEASIWFRNTQTGKTLANSFNDIRQMASSAWTKAQEPFGGDPEDVENLRKKQNQFIDDYFPESIAGSKKVASAVRGGAKGALQFGEELTSPVQIGLMVGTFGESALARTAASMGLPKLVPAARVMGKLIQAQFISQMVEGGYTSIRDSVKTYISGDWDTATQQAVVGLGSLLMARAGISHAEATEKIHADLDKTAVEKHGQKFNKLSPENQGLVIEETVNRSPEYKAMMETVDAKNAEVADSIQKKRQMQVARYSGIAWDQAWNPDAAHRAVDALHAERAETARKEQVQKVVGTIRARVKQRTDEIKAENEERLAAAREGREEKRKAAAEDRESVQQTAEEIIKGRDETFAGRQAIGEIPTEEEMSRPVEAAVDNSGHVSYPVQYWGEENRFGVGTDGERHSVYRQTPRGVEWLDRSGNFTETPEALYFNTDDKTSDTVARLSSLKLESDGVAAQPEATAEQVKDAETLGEIRRQLIEGEINAAEAQKRAGIAEKTTLPDVYAAAREGRLSGPFSEKSATDYEHEVVLELLNNGASEEEVQATLESLPALARVDIERNLHHVYQPGDYIISKRDVKWTLDAKGLLHPSDGGISVPLMKRGTYSNQAMQLAASGRVGYGTKTRLERRADFSRNRDIKRQIAVRQEEFDREMRVAQQNAGLEAIPQEGDVHYEGEREERRKQFLGRPPVPEETHKARVERRAAYKASNDPNNIINQLAKQFGVTPDEVMRIGLSERTPTIEAKVASLEVGDRVSDPFRPDRPWIVEEKNGQTYLRSGQANPIPFDRLNPSPRVFQILEKGDITHDRDWTAEEKEKVAFEKPYLVHQRFLVDGVRDRMEGKVVDPEPKTQVQAETQAAAAESRKAAAHSVAVEAAEKATNPEIAHDDTPEKAVAKAEELARKAEDAKKVAKEAVAQSAEAKAKTGPKGNFPQRYVPNYPLGKPTTIDQNGRQLKAHYRLVPVGAVIISHTWKGDTLVRTPENEYPKVLQPREPNERTILQRRIDAQRFSRSEDGRISGYNFDKYANKTIDAMSGPTVVEHGLRSVAGTGRFQRFLMHIQVLKEIPDVEEREGALAVLKERLVKLAEDSGFRVYPEDGQFHIVVRELDDPIQTMEEATKLGLLFNESEADNISDSQKGLVYSRSFDQDVINKIGRMVEGSEGGMNAAMRDNPLFFAEVVASRFDIPVSQASAWFVKDKMGNDVLTEEGERLFRRAMNGYVIQDPDLLAGVENEVAYRAFENAIGYISRLKAFPELDLTGKIKESLEAARLTGSVNRDLAASGDPWDAVYQPSQIDLAGMEEEPPPEPDRMTETLWRSLNASKVAAPRVFSDRMKRWISDEDTQAGMFDSTEKALEKPVDKFNRVFAPELKQVALRRNKGTPREGTPDGWMLSQTEYDAAMQGREVSDEERVEEKPEATPKFEHMDLVTVVRGPGDLTTNVPGWVSDVLPDGRLKVVPDSKLHGGMMTVPAEWVVKREETPKFGPPPKAASTVEVGKRVTFTPTNFNHNEIVGVVRDTITSTSGAKGYQIVDDAGIEHRVWEKDGTIGAETKAVDQKAINGLNDEERSLRKRQAVLEAQVKKPSGMIPPAITSELNVKRSAELHDIQKRLDAIIDERRKLMKGGIKPPPEAASPAVVADRKIAAEKTEQGYITPHTFKEMLNAFPVTKENAGTIYDTAKALAAARWERRKPEGVEHKDALAWVLKEIGFKGIEKGDDPRHRGEYDFATGVMRLNKAADKTTAIHEFIHAISPLLDEEEWEQIDTIKVNKAAYKREYGKDWAYTGQNERMEKLAYGSEKFFRDENAVDFQPGFELRKVLKDIKEMFISVYRKLQSDPLSPFKLSDDFRQWMADNLGITGFDVADDWREEVKKARAAEKKIVRPEEQPHPVVTLARELGGTGLRESIDGKVVDEVGDRVDPKKPVVVIMFPSEEEATSAVSRIADGKDKINGAELIHGKDGTWAMKISAATKIPRGSLFQELPKSEIMLANRRPNVVVRQLKDIDGNVLGQIVEPYDGTEEGAIKAARITYDKMIRLPRYGMSGMSRVAATDAEGTPKWMISPYSSSAYKESIAEIGTDEAREMFDFPEKVGSRTRRVDTRALLAKWDEEAKQAIEAKKKDFLEKTAQRSPIAPPSAHPSADVMTIAERHPGLQLEDLEKRLRETPSYKTFERRLVQGQIDRLKARIRNEAGLNEPEPQRDPELPKQVLQEVKNAQASDRGRTANDDAPGISKPPRVGGIPKPPQLGVSGYAGAKRGGPTPRSSVPRAPVNLENVKPVTLEPLAGVRGEPVGMTTGEKFDQKAWVERKKKGGIAEGTPYPTWALEHKTASQLMSGQPVVVQTVMSALEQGDGVVVVTPPGTGKSKYVGPAIIKEYLRKKPDANILNVSMNKRLLKEAKKSAANNFGLDYDLDPPSGEPGIYCVSFMGMLNNEIYKNTKWDLVLVDESGGARRAHDENTQWGPMLMDVVANSEKAVYMSATPFHSPNEYFYIYDKLNLGPKGQFDKWIQENFAHEKIGDKIVARLDPGKQAKLREQLIADGRFVSQAISYDGYNAHFGVVPVTDHMKRGLDRIREGFDRARDQFVRMGKQGLARKAAAFEAVYTKNFLERERLPQAIELAKQAREQGWRVLFFSEHTADDLFRRERTEGEEPGTYQQLDDAMGGQLSKIIPAYPSIYNELYAEFGDKVGDYSGRGNTDAAREKTRTDFLKGEVPMMYTSYAGGGIGVDMHDADYPELNVKGGSKPIVAIYLGPPYSGVLLEQAMGRPWRFGVKSDVHAVFLATDSEPDIRLMQTKVGPRMKALRAAVLGERDSLGNVMSTYTDEEKVRERQDQLAYAEGNEVKVNATQFQVRSKQRNVGIQDWSAITFPSAEEAKNKGMKYGEAVTGGDWSSLYQSKFELRPPDSTESIRGKEEIDAIGIGATFNPPPSLQNLEPADRNAVVGGASAMAADGVELPVDRDKEAVARQTMQWALHIPKGMELTYERQRTRFGLKKAKAVWKFPEGKEPYNRPIGPFGEGEMEDKTTRYIGWGSMKGGIESMTRQAGVPEIGLQLTDMIGSAQRDQDVFKSMYRYHAVHAFEDNGLKRDGNTVAEVRDVVEGKTSSANPAITKAAAEMRDLNEWAASEVQKAGVKRHLSGGNWEPWVPRANYFTHQIDWDADVEYQDPHTGNTERHPLKDVMKRTFPEEKHRDIMARLASRARNSDGTAVSPEAMDNWLRQHYRRGTPVQPNIQEQRTIEFPVLKNDWGVIDSYGDQLGKAIGIARNFGSEREKINELVAKIPSAGARRDITTIFDSILSPQQLSGNWRKFTNAFTAFTALTKMPLSFAKVPFHSLHMIYALHGDVRPMVKAAAKMMVDFKNVHDENVYMGTLARQTDFTGAIEGWQSKGAQHWMFDVTGFNAMYNVSRIFASEAARIHMEQYAMNDLLKGGKRAEEARRILNHTMLIGDGDIDQAIANRRFSAEDIRRAQVAFANEVMFTDNPTEMPKWAREPITRETAGSAANVFKAMRLAYSMASFTVKTRMFLRKHIWDETFRYHNPKMLALFAVMEPIIGAGVTTVGSTLKSGIQRSIGGITGQPKKEDALDREKLLFENAWKGGWGKKGLAEKAELYIDLLTWGTAQEQVRLWGDMLLNVAASPKKAIAEARYFGPDLLEGAVGPIWNSTVIRPLGWATDEVAIWARGGPKENKRAWARLWKEIFGESSISSNIPQVKKLEAPPK